MNPLEWLCQNIVTYGAKAQDNGTYTCRLKAKKCTDCSIENRIINNEPKKYYICNKKGINEKITSLRLAFI